jgi:hypothetical protein
MLRLNGRPSGDFPGQVELAGDAESVTNENAVETAC